jgi:hypothetical protein
MGETLTDGARLSQALQAATAERSVAAKIEIMHRLR